MNSILNYSCDLEAVINTKIGNNLITLMRANCLSKNYWDSKYFQYLRKLSKDQMLNEINVKSILTSD
jgi:hypothetical protein